MQKQAPSLGSVLVAVGFTLSCFGLLLFLWAAFGGPIPFKPQGYRFKADFPEATQLAVESDVRIAGVSVGKVKQIELAPAESGDPNRTRATIEIAEDFAPLPFDAKAILRQKTLLGETYVELTQGSKGAKRIPEGGVMEGTQVRDATQIDEIFNALDEDTRTAFQQWQREIAVIIEGRGLEFSDALGNLGPFVDNAADVLQTLNRQNEQLKQVVYATGGVFEALTERGQALSGAVSNSNAAFGALASRDAALRETFQVFPTFLREQRTTLARLEKFAVDTRPLVLDLKPVADDLAPAIKDLRRTAPDLEQLFRDLDPLLTASEDGLPALRFFFKELGPVFDSLDPFLANLNPVVRYLNAHKLMFSDFMGAAGAASSGTLQPSTTNDPLSTNHTLRVATWLGQETLGLHQTRLATNRGNGYLSPGSTAIGNPRTSAVSLPWPTWDCKNVPGGEKSDFTQASAACLTQDDYPSEFGGKSFPQITRDP